MGENKKQATYQFKSSQVCFWIKFKKQTRKMFHFRQWPNLSSNKFLSHFLPPHKSQCAVKVGCVLASTSSVAPHRRRSWVHLHYPTLPTPLHLQPDLVMQMRAEPTWQAANGVESLGWDARPLSSLDQREDAVGGRCGASKFGRCPEL